MRTRPFTTALVALATVLAIVGCGVEQAQSTSSGEDGQQLAQAGGNHGSVVPPTSDFVVTGQRDWPEEPGVYAANSPTNIPMPDIYPTIEQRFRDAGVTRYPTIVGDPPTVTEFIQDLELRGIKAIVLDEDDKSLWPSGQVEHCLGAPRRSYDLSVLGRLHIFLYDSTEGAAGTAADIPFDADCGPISWAHDVHYFLHGKMIVFLATEDPDTYEILNGWLGPPFACGKGPPFNTQTCHPE